jgi:DNA-damage-inducible protein D
VPKRTYEEAPKLDTDPREPLERFVKTDPDEIETQMASKDIEIVYEKARSEAISALVTALEAAKQIDEEGTEYWSARTLAQLLGYKRWENFDTAISRGMVACANVREGVSDHFREVTKMIEVGKGARREHKDFELTRFASWLIAMNGDPSKEEVAAAQTYFAVQTRRQQLADEAQAQAPALTEDERRVLIRNELKEHNKPLASAAKAHGVKKPVEYAVFQNEGYKGLYGGFDVRGIRRRRRLTDKQDILDHMPSASLPQICFGRRRRRRSWKNCGRRERPERPLLIRPISTSTKNARYH